MLKLRIVKRLLFVFIFSVYSFIFYFLFYYGTSYFFPNWLEAPSPLDKNYISAVLGAFTIIIALSYIGASYIVFGSLSSSRSVSSSVSSSASSSRKPFIQNQKQNQKKDQQEKNMPSLLSPRPLADGKIKK